MGKVLIVEDNEIICESLKSIIKITDPFQEVYSTGFAAIGLEYALEQKVDVFILDIQLMDYSGTDLAKKIRQLNCYKMTPILFITSDHNRELEAFRNAQCYKFITKPFRAEDVKETLAVIFQHGIKDSGEEVRFSIKQKGFTISVLQNDIMYFESRNRKLFAVTLREEIGISKRTQADIMEMLTKDFIQCHKGFIVNCKWIHSIDKANQMITLKDQFGQIPYGNKFKERLEGVWI